MQRLVAQHLDSFFIHQITDNIVLYKLSNSNSQEFGIEENGLFKEKLPAVFSALLRNKSKLFLRYDSTSLKYPKPNYMVFKFQKNNGYTFELNDTLAIKYEYYDSYSSNIFLVAVNKLDSNIKFISGGFYLSKIAKDFDLRVDNPASFYEYLKFRLYQYNISEVYFDKQDKYFFYFKAKSAYYKYLIKVNKNDFDIFKISTILMVK
jgi:hypothetical protein